MNSYYNPTYGSTYIPDVGTAYYNETYGAIYIPGKGTGYFNQTYGVIYIPGEDPSYHNQTYGATYTPGKGTSYYNSSYNSTYSSYSNKNNNNNYSSSDCFISTACIEAKNFSDDCYELNMLRKYRDKLASENENLKPLLKEYYQNAPTLVKKINAHPHKLKIYDYIYNNLIIKSIGFLISGDFALAVKQYSKIYQELKEYFNN